MMMNPKGELCTACGKPAKGYAFIDDKRYCHGDEPGETCYEGAWPLSHPVWPPNDEGRAEPGADSDA